MISRPSRICKNFWTGTYDGTKKKDQVDLASCGYEPRSTSTGGKARARRREWEHVMPAENYGRAFAAWREGHPDCIDSKGQPLKGRQCAKKVAPAFRFMEADLYNLQPAIGEVNGRRSNYRPAMIPGEKREFGACDVEIADKQVEPRPEIRGDIARTYLYMAAAYPQHARLSKRNRQLFAAWAKEDPVNDWERERGRRIAEIQGNSNPFIQ